MRIFTHWTKINRTLQIGRESVICSCFGGSNASVEEAARDAERRLQFVANRVQGREVRDENYEADILEEMIAKIDSQNLVTRTRYGAEVLNSADHVFVDIDKPAPRFLDIFASFRNSNEAIKSRIIEQVENRSQKLDLQSVGVRIYETHKGIRLLISGIQIKASSAAASDLLRSYHADGLFTYLCRRQNCYRARLTPKPHRMRCRTMKVTYPRDAVMDQKVREWVMEYDQLRIKFSTCKFVKQLGRNPRDAVIDFHDKATGACSGLPLA